MSTSSRTVKTVLAATATIAVVGASIAVAGPATAVPVPPQSRVIAFDGLDGWNQRGIEAKFDWEADSVHDALRFSNAVTDPNAYGAIAQLSSPAVLPAGEPGSGTTFDTFAASFTVSSVTGHVQPGLNIEVDADTGGNRAGGLVGLRHTGTSDSDGGLEITGRWLDPSATGADLSDWRSKSVTVPATAAHTITYAVTFLPDAPDLTRIYVDGTLAIQGTSWEGYSKAAAGDGYVPLSVDSLNFRTSRSVPTAEGIGWTTVDPTADQIEALRGNGLLFSGLAYSSYSSVAPAVSLTTSAAGYGKPATTTVTVAGGSAQVGSTAVPGNVTLLVDGNAVGTQPVTSGAARFTLPANLSVGAHQLSAAYTGDAVTLAGSAASTVTVAKAGSVVDLKLSAAKATAGKKSVTARVFVSTPGAATTPTGTITLKVGSKTVATVPAPAAGKQATVALPVVKKAGKTTVTASYVGDTSVEASSASAALKIVKAKTATTLSLSKKTAVQHKTILKAKITVKVKGSTLKPSGKVKVTVGGKSLKAVKVSSKGKVTVKLPAPKKAGELKVRVAYVGNDNLASSKSKTVVVKVRKSSK